MRDARRAKRIVPFLYSNPFRVSAASRAIARQRFGTVIEWIQCNLTKKILSDRVKDSITPIIGGRGKCQPRKTLRAFLVMRGYGIAEFWLPRSTQNDRRAVPTPGEIVEPSTFQGSESTSEASVKGSVTCGRPHCKLSHAHPLRNRVQGLPADHHGERDACGDGGVS
jgi:hypothetical protein